MKKFNGFCFSILLGLAIIVVAMTGILATFSLWKLFWTYLFGG